MTDCHIHQLFLLRRLSGNIVSDLYHFVRSQKQLTSFFGPQYSSHRKFAQIDITYKCNLRCNGCNRSCTQAPIKHEMTIAQVKAFVQESIDNGINWERIDILGGEPTLHTDLFGILDLLLEYKKNNNSDLRIELYTNGTGMTVRDILAKMPSEIKIINSDKSSKLQLHIPFNMAPQDSSFYRNVDYSNGCRILTICGMGYTPYGYYPCAVAGGIDRVFGFNLGRKNLPSPDDQMTDLLQIFCRLCGHFRFNLPIQSGKVSSSWKTAYSLYQSNQL